MLEFLPDYIKDAIKHLNIQQLYEIRIRVGQPITVNYQGKYRYLCARGYTDRRENALKCTFEELSDCIYRAGKYSVYSVEEQLRQGFLTAEMGERIGLAGEYVFENGRPLTIRHFTSVCVRIPHEIIGCGEEIYNLCMSDIIRNLLIVSSPGIGKTTILRDLARIFSKKTAKNILICDERGELALGEFGETCDVIKYSDKETAFTAGIRAMRPDIIITDELSKKDLTAVEKAVDAGVNVIASAHFSQMNKIDQDYREIFDCIVILNKKNIGKIEEIYKKSENGWERTC